MKIKIEKAIDSIEEYLENCRPQTFSNSKIVVDRNVLNELLLDLRNQIPKEIEQYQKVISSRDSILNNARERAERVVKKAEEERQRLIDESDIKQSAQEEANQMIEQAQEEAQQIIDEANAQADEIVNAAYDESDVVQQNAAQYMDDVLDGMQNWVASTLKVTEGKFNAYVRAMEELQDRIAESKEEVSQNISQEEVEEEYPDEDDYDEDDSE